MERSKEVVDVCGSDEGCCGRFVEGVVEYDLWRLWNVCGALRDVTESNRVQLNLRSIDHGDVRSVKNRNTDCSSGKRETTTRNMKKQI